MEDWHVRYRRSPSLPPIPRRVRRARLGLSDPHAGAQPAHHLEPVVVRIDMGRRGFLVQQQVGMEGR